jgi:hypothetical protein
MRELENTADKGIVLRIAGTLGPQAHRLVVEAAVRILSAGVPKYVVTSPGKIPWAPWRHGIAVAGIGFLAETGV